MIDDYRSGWRSGGRFIVSGSGTSVSNHESNSVAYVPNVGFIAAHDSQTIAVVSQDGRVWGAIPTDRVMGELPMLVLGPNVYGVDTQVVSQEKVVRGDSATYPYFDATQLGVTGLTDAVNCWAASGKEIILLESGGRVTYIPTGSEDEVPPAGSPTAPTITAIFPSSQQATITYTSPGASVTSYVIQYSLDYGATWTTATSFGANSSELTKVVTQLTNGTQYIFRVAGVNTNGRGHWSEVSVPVTPAVTVPTAPSNVVATPTGPMIGTPPSNSRFILSWSAPTSTGGSAITGYKVELMVGDRPYDIGTSTSPATSTTIATSGTQVATALRIGFLYSFRVSAINAAGTGPASAASAPTTLR
jgi:hypothetical protein